MPKKKRTKLFPSQVLQRHNQECIPEVRQGGRRVKTQEELAEQYARGQAMKAIRERWQDEADKNVTHLCNDAGVSWNTYYSYEAGRADWAVAMIAKITAVLPMRVVIENGQVKVERKR